MLWAGLQAAMWITHVGGTFRHGLLEKSLRKFFLTVSVESGARTIHKSRFPDKDGDDWGSLENFG